MLPGVLQKSLQTVITSTSEPQHSAVSRAISEAVVAVDTAITSEFLRMFPRGEKSVRQMDKATAGAFINDISSGGYRHTCASRILGGSTLLVTLLEEGTGRLWVANLGDSAAGVYL